MRRMIVPAVAATLLAMVAGCNAMSGVNDFDFNPAAVDAQAPDGKAGSAGADVVQGPDADVNDDGDGSSPDDVSDAGQEETPDVSEEPDADAPQEAQDGADEGQDAPEDSQDGPWQCTSNASCVPMPATPYCDTSTGKCVACLTANDTCPTGQYCAAATLTCEPGCKGDPDCVQADAGSTDAGNMTCDLQTHQCMGCTVDTQCPLGTVCTTPTCVPGCTVQHGCPSAQSCCTGSCQDTKSDIHHCGTCGHACAIVDHGTAGCSNGICGIASCDGGYHESGGACVRDGCVKEVVAGLGHTCVRRSDGVALCWGANNNGQIGNGQTSTNVPTPYAVATLGSTVIGLGRDQNTSLAVKSDNTLWCWGYAGDNECGDGATGNMRVTPVLTPLSPSAAATGGWWHTCASKTTGGLWCWGSNQTGEVGDGTSGGSVATPSKVVGLTDVTQFCGGYAHTCARTSDGKAWCWGWKTYGQVGDGSVTGKQTTPYNITALGTSVVEVACGMNHSCARTAAGAIWCWGNGALGQIGTGSTTTNNPVPAQIFAAGSTNVQVAAWGNFTCARRANGTIWCWGENADGQVGNGKTTASEPNPVQATALSVPAIDLVAGTFHTCARDGFDNLWCWGRNSEAQLGAGSTSTPKTTAVQAVVPCP